MTLFPILSTASSHRTYLRTSRANSALLVGREAHRKPAAQFATLCCTENNANGLHVSGYYAILQSVVASSNEYGIYSNDVTDLSLTNVVTYANSRYGILFLDVKGKCTTYKSRHN